MNFSYQDPSFVLKKTDIFGPPKTIQKMPLFFELHKGCSHQENSRFCLIYKIPEGISNPTPFFLWLRFPYPKRTRSTLVLHVPGRQNRVLNQSPPKNTIKSLHMMALRQSVPVENAQKKGPFFGPFFSGPKNDVFLQGNFSP